MGKEILNRTRIAAVRFTAAEYAALERRFKTTACRQMSEYLRSCLLNKPIIVKHRDASLDEFMLEFIRLRKELSALGNNFNQSVRRLHAMQHNDELRQWISEAESQRERLLAQTESIARMTEKMTRRWLQS
ncbi:plasmid mobilization protein [Flavobacterium tistrianum]|uniref:plasmid mobilization protein n=1 Tax=Flavobacterium tistrianum TaxID=1685414 RepID=UPI000DAC5C8D|nr:plasmid mobilization relaxosome protein MobC [Flavobacterium tistrianum]KAF2340397.1 plasmid mobilization relaxosome protein MobC [Flavobacterium tistrianum]